MNLQIIHKYIYKMKLFILTILLIGCIGKHIYKNQLRGMHQIKTYQVLEKEIYTNLYNSILEYAEKGKTEYHFNIMCTKLNKEENILNKNCTFNQHQYWVESHQSHHNLSNYNITLDEFSTDLINKLRETFIDSDIIKSYKNCCDYYIIKW